MVETARHRCFLPAVLLVLAACGTGEPQPQPPVGGRTVLSVDIVPSVIHVDRGRSFVVRVAVRDEDGYLLPEFVRDSVTGGIGDEVKLTVSWRLVSGSDGWDESPVPDSPHHHRRIVRSPSTDGAQYTKLIAEVGGQTAAAELILVGDQTPPEPSMDPFVPPSVPLIKLPYAANEPPIALVMDGSTAPGFDLVQAGVGSISPGTASNPISGQTPLALLAAGRGLRFGPEDIVSGQPHDLSTPMPVLRVYLVPWLATAGLFQPKIDSLKTRIENEVDFANHVFGQNRVGVEFEIWNQIEELSGISTITSTTLCSSAATAVTGLSTGPALDQRVIHVIYLPRGIGFRGIACADNADEPGGRRATFVRVFMDAATPATLAHELGHALGLRGSRFAPHDSGHPNDDPDYDAADVMWNGVVMEQAVSQRRLALAQSVHLNVDSSSWLQRAIKDHELPDETPVRLIPPHLVEKCPSDVSPCPAASVDMNDAQ